MIFDKMNMFSEEQLMGTTAASTNYIDLGAARRIARGEPIRILIQVIADFTTLTSLKVGLQQDTVSNFASPTTLVESAVIAQAALVPGYRFAIEYVPDEQSERYLRLYYTIVGDEGGANGSLTAGIVLDKQSVQY